MPKKIPTVRIDQLPPEATVAVERYFANSLEQATREDVPTIRISDYEVYAVFDRARRLHADRPDLCIDVPLLESFERTADDDTDFSDLVYPVIDSAGNAVYVEEYAGLDEAPAGYLHVVLFQGRWTCTIRERYVRVARLADVLRQEAAQ
jgi:hypothetical protein